MATRFISVESHRVPDTPETTDFGAASIATALRSHRTRRQLSLAAAARLSGVSAAHLSRVENGERSPSIGVLLQLARAYAVPLGVLVGEDASIGSESVTVRRREDIAIRSTDELEFELLGSNSATVLIQPLRVHVPPGASTRRRSHDGEEWVHVEAGEIQLDVGAETVVLRVGDSAQFGAELEHRLRNPTSTTTRVLLVSSVGHREHHTG